MSNSSGSSGIDVVGLLGVAFIVLKLVGVIDWSWWWVTAPFWGGLALALLAAAAVVLYVVAERALATLCWKRK